MIGKNLAVSRLGRRKTAMPFQIVRNDITRMHVDAIVNAANSSLLGGGGVDGAIHRAAGPQLLEECRTLGGCGTGQAKITKGYDLPCRYVIHTVGPRWKGGARGEKDLLISCYRSSLELAEKNGCETVAFPLISSGAYGYPKEEAMNVAVDTITSFLAGDHEMTVFLVVFGRTDTALGQKISKDLKEYIDDHYADAHRERNNARRRRYLEAEGNAVYSLSDEASGYHRPEESTVFHPTLSAVPAPQSSPSLKNRVVELDESFQQMLLRMIDERGMSDAQCYKKANIDRKLFSKIRGDVHYKPSKPTVLAFAVALELTLPQTEAFLRTAGYALSRSYVFDIIIQYFIERGNYNIFEINEALFDYDQSLLGS